MGFLSEGEWVSDEASPVFGSKKAFDRKPTVFHGVLSRDGSTGFPADPSRYHLYVSLACPWAHRALILIKLKNLEGILQVSIVDPVMTDADGWVFSNYQGCILDPVNNFTHLRQVYQKSDPKVSCRVTVPVLFDKIEQKIVNNESSEIIKMLNECFDGPDLYPIELRSKIDEINEWVYNDINNGVYKAGFVADQELYRQAVLALFRALDRVEEILENSRYIAGKVLTLADIRLFTTLVRFDAVYVGHFKCNLKRLVDYPNIWNYVKDIYQTSAIGETVDLHHIKKHYYVSHTKINPTGVVPEGPEIEFLGPHDRASKFAN